MKKWNLIFDVALCTGCRNCVLAVKDEYVGNDFPGYTREMPRHGHPWVDIRQRERGRFPAVELAYLFHACQHCDNAPCVAAAENNAVTKRADGIVMIDPERAKGQKRIVEACPYGAVYWNEALSLPQHWNFDAHLLDAGWSVPRPVQACPTGALHVVKVEDDEMRRIAQNEALERLEDGVERGTRIHYRNLARYTSGLVAGSLVGSDGGMEVCVAGAQVRLFDASTEIASTVSDSYGDFRFDAAATMDSRCRIEVRADGYERQSVDWDRSGNSWVGEIRLQRGGTRS